HQCVARTPAVAGVAQHRAADVLGPPLLPQDLDPFRRMALGVGMPLPVEVVDQPGEPPALDVLAVLSGIGAQRDLDGVAMLAKVRVLHPFMEQAQSLLAGGKRSDGHTGSSIVRGGIGFSGAASSASRGNTGGHLLSKCSRFLSM